MRFTLKSYSIFRQPTLAIVVFLFSELFVNAQWVKDDDTSKVWLKDGVYLNEKEFLTNSPSHFWADIELMHWRTKDSLRRKRVLIYPRYEPHAKSNLSLNHLRIYALKNDSVRIFRMDSIWGFCIHGEPFRHVIRARNENFIRIQIDGTISYLRYTVYYQDPFYWSPDLHNNEPQFHNERVDLIIDFKEREFYANNRSNLEEIIKRNKGLWQAYQNEGSRRYRVLEEYIDKYNNLYPIDDAFEQLIEADSSFVEPDKP